MGTYNRDARCPKCGGVDIGSLYCSSCWASQKVGMLHKEPRMHRTCQNCGYQWLEKPLDANDPEMGGSCAD